MARVRITPWEKSWPGTSRSVFRDTGVLLVRLSPDGIHQKNRGDFLVLSFCSFPLSYITVSLQYCDRSCMKVARNVGCGGMIVTTRLMMLFSKMGHLRLPTRGDFNQWIAAIFSWNIECKVRISQQNALRQETAAVGYCFLM